jgi:hypothetical protein
MTIKPTTTDEFNDGSTYVAWVAAGDGFFFYDESPYAYYTAGNNSTTALDQISAAEAGLRFTQEGERLCIEGLNEGEHITLTTAAGATLWQGTARRTKVSFPVAGVHGPILVTVSGAARTVNTKVILK